MLYSCKSWQKLKEALDQLVLDVQHMEKNLPSHLQPAKNSPKTSEPRLVLPVTKLFSLLQPFFSCHKAT